ncbi:MAG: beta-lactamase family protein [Verrucomicrobia bacterium]|nr:beta-lactamase family protein [Verrucomicrobiota bacterium]
MLGALLLPAIHVLFADALPAGDLWLESTDTRTLEAGDPTIVAALKPIWRKHRLPAIAGGIITRGGLDRLGTIGVRQTGTRVAVTLADQWHLGSETKAMTATLAARLVERGSGLRWDSTVAGVFPELAETFDPGMKPVTLEALLNHRAGIAKDLDWHSLAATGNDVRGQRVQVVKTAMGSPPRNTSGPAYHYSNVGYVVAGAMIERVTGRAWEQVIQEQLFAPLGMNATGFGGTGTPGQLDQPWGHIRAGQPVPNNGPATDNPPVLGPAGRVHASLQDWARFLTDQLRGAGGQSGLLQAASYSKLFTPPAGGDYALGWLVANREWGGGTVYTHAGCNTMNYAVAWLAPRRGFGVFVCINQGDDEAAKAADAAAGALIELRPDPAEEMGMSKRADVESAIERTAKGSDF